MTFSLIQYEKFLDSSKTTVKELSNQNFTFLGVFCAHFVSFNSIN